MREISREELGRLLEGATERRNLEFKPALSWRDPKSQWLVEKIVRGVLGLSNTPSGGVLVVGIEQSESGQIVIPGISDAQLEAFENSDAVKGHIDGFASTATAFELAFGKYEGVKLLTFQVSEFERRPIICRKNGTIPKTLCEGDLYVRSLRAPYSTVRATAEELEEIIDLAVDKESARLAGRGWRRTGRKNPEEFYKGEVSDLD